MWAETDDLRRATSHALCLLARTAQGRIRQGTCAPMMDTLHGLAVLFFACSLFCLGLYMLTGKRQ